MQWSVAASRANIRRATNLFMVFVWEYGWMTMLLWPFEGFFHFIHFILFCYPPANTQNFLPRGWDESQHWNKIFDYCCAGNSISFCESFLNVSQQKKRGKVLRSQQSASACVGGKKISHLHLWTFQNVNTYLLFGGCNHK